MITFYLIIKDNITTQFMQACGVFEKFKFAGKRMKVDGEIKTSLLDAFKTFRDQNKGGKLELVGVIVPEKGSVILENHTVISEGTIAYSIEHLCDHYHAPAQIIQ